MQDLYEADHAKYPNTIFMTTEQFSRDMYDGWRRAEKHSWILGEFIWSGIDYIGEVGSGSSELRTIGGKLPDFPYVTELWDYPAYLSGCGEVDISGKRKPQGLYRDVLWGRSALELLVQRPLPDGKFERVSDWGWHDELESWTWSVPAGQAITVRAYTSGDAVTLLLNGKPIGAKSVTDGDKLKAEFSVLYMPGTLEAIAYKNGAEIGRKTLETVDPPAALRLVAERSRIAASANDLGYVAIEVCDAKGRKVPDGLIPVTVSVSGAANLRATGSANPRGLKDFRSPHVTTFHGEALAIVQPGTARGEVRVTAFSPGLTPHTISIAVG